MSTYPNQGQDPNQPYGGGYRAKKPADDPYANPNISEQGQQSYQDSYQEPTGYGQQQQQQQQTYQPPLSATLSHGGQDASDATSTGMPGQRAALLSYLVFWLSGLVFLVIERKNHFVRFNAAQSLLAFGPIFLVYSILQWLSGVYIIGFIIGPILFILNPVIYLVTAALWLFLMFQAYRGIKFKLPIVGEYAEGLANWRLGKKK